MQKNTVVTLNLGNNTSNTFLIDTDEGETLLITHPLLKGLLYRVQKSAVNKSSANVKDSTERCIDFANSNKSYLDYNTIGELEALGMYFAFKRHLTPRQKQSLSFMCGVIASIKLSNNVNKAMSLISKNDSILDEFNLMWYNNFKGLFNGTQPITSPKQRSAIFNIAGYVLAELENPTTQTRK